MPSVGNVRHLRQSTNHNEKTKQNVERRKSKTKTIQPLKG